MLPCLTAILVTCVGPAAHRASAQDSAAHGGAPAAGAASTPAPAPCPTAAETARIAAAYAKAPAPMPFAAAPALQLPEIVVASGLPPALGLSVAGSHFAAVWKSLGDWPAATVMIRKGGSVFEVSTRIPGGEPSKRSNYFNLGHAFPFSGHLRSDLLTAIQGVKLEGGEGALRGVFFFDASGESVFGVFLPGEGATPDVAAVAAFDRTWALLQSLPPRCPHGAG
jgi:putative heme iron utilization protein